MWDVKCLAAGRPLWKEAGGAQSAVPVYSTEGGWLHVEPKALVDDALAVKEQGFGGAKIKVGRPHVSEDIARLAAVREAVGPGFEIMVDANQAFTVGTNMMGYTPVLGTQVRFVLLGGVEIGTNTLLRWYVLHVLMLPFVLVIFMAIHFWRVRKDGGISGPL